MAISHPISGDRVAHRYVTRTGTLTACGIQVDMCASLVPPDATDCPTCRPPIAAADGSAGTLPAS